MRKRFTVANFVFPAVIGLLSVASLQAQNPDHNIAAANIAVVQNDSSNSTNSVSVTTPISINGFAIRPGSNRGDYNVRIGASANDDVDTGVLMTSIAENGRDNGETNSPGLTFCTSAVDYSRAGVNAGSYYIPVFNTPDGDEFNINVSAAFFPYTNWIGGYARNSGDTNGGANDLFTGSSGLILGTHFIDSGGGRSTVNLTGLGIDSRTDGVMLVTHGENEDNYALSQVNSDGTWTLYVKDNGTDAGSYEQDPVAFVFIPRTNTSVVSGRFRGDGTRLMFSGATPSFNITNIGAGTWRLTISGQSPATGVLIVSAEGGLSQNQDNIVSYQPEGDGWIIQSRDLPGNPPNLQTPGGGLEPVASFVFIPTALNANIISPADHAQNLSKTPTLQVSVTNATSNALTVQFFGRVAVSNPPTDFAIVALPDTQYYTAERFGGTKEMFIAQTEWIITNRVSRNIAYVAHLGDISDSGDIKSGSANLTEWRNATNAMYRIEDPARTFLSHGVPYGMAVGNHDQEPIGNPNGTTTYFNQFFGVSHFSGRPYYAGHYGSNNNNHFDFFSAGGMDFVVLYFEYDTGANAAVLAWGNEVLRTNAHRRAIVVTHNFGNTQTPLSFSAQGTAIYTALRTNSNVFLMLAGHITGEGSRVDTFNGNTIRTFVQDYQGRTNGGNGFLRIYNFSPANNQVVAQTFSPWTGEYETDANSEFFFPYNMQQPLGTNESPFEVIGTSSNVPPGNVVSLVWSNRQANTPYEWYVVLTDTANNLTTSPTWRFSTAPLQNSPPVASNQLFTVIGDAPTNLVLHAFDPDGDPLLFFTNSVPMHGLIQNFNSTDGTLTYLPTRGFRSLDRFVFYASDGVSATSPVTMNLNVIAPSDSDGNGLPDAWEAAFGISDPDGDDDGDRQSNRDEYFANTNPTNAASVLRINQASRAANGHVTLSWPTVGGTRYRIQFSNADANGTFSGTFTDIFRLLEQEMNPVSYGTPATQTFVDDFTLTGGPGGLARYYRIKIVQ